MHYQYRNVWIIMRPEVKSDGIHFAMSIGTVTAMDDGGVKVRPKYTIGIKGPFANEEEGQAAASAYAERWVDENPGWAR